MTLHMQVAQLHWQQRDVVAAAAAAETAFPAAAAAAVETTSTAFAPQPSGDPGFAAAAA